MKIKVIVITTVLAIIFGQVAITFPLLTDDRTVQSSDLNSKNFTLIKEFGEIFYKKFQEQTFTPVQSDILELPMNTYVKTQKGNAHILLPDNSLITLSENTELHVFMKDETPSINQFLGKTWYRIKHLTGIVEDRVYTPSVTVSVRGTVFNVEVKDASSTDIFNSEGSVEVKKYGTDGTYVDKQILTAGQIAREEDSKFEVSTVDENYLSDPWIKDNQNVDEDWHVKEASAIVQEYKDSKAITASNQNTTISSTSSSQSATPEATADTENVQVSSPVADKPKEDLHVNVINQVNNYNNGEITTNSYTVKSGDTLWEIAEARYGSGFNWVKIKNSNLSKIYFDHLGQQTIIIPGSVLTLP